MKISLKEARRIERRIESAITNNAYSLVSSIEIYTENGIINSIVDAENKVEHDVLNSIALISARAEIRRNIQAVNEKSGINEFISARDESIKILNIWQDVNRSTKQVQSKNSIVKTLENKLMRLDSGKEDYYSSRTNEISFTAISDLLAEHSVKKIRSVQTKIDSCDDSLANLNAITKIEISEVIVELLKDNNII